MTIQFEIDQLVTYLNESDPYIMEKTHRDCCGSKDRRGDPYAGFTWRILSIDTSKKIADIILVKWNVAESNQPTKPERKNVPLSLLEPKGTSFSALIEEAEKFIKNRC